MSPLDHPTCPICQGIHALALQQREPLVDAVATLYRLCQRPCRCTTIFHQPLAMHPHRLPGCLGYGEEDEVRHGEHV